MKLQSLILGAIMVLFSFLAMSETYSKQRADSPPGIVIAQNDMIPHLILSSVTLAQVPISRNCVIASAASPMIESERMVVAPIALLSRSLKTTLNSKSLKYSKSEVRKSYIQNIERFSGYIPKLC